MSGQPKQQLNLMQIQADIYLADSAIKEALKRTPKAAKYLKGQAGYHIQQAVEKMVKIQMYHLCSNLNYSKMYKHSIDDLLLYSQSLGLNLVVPGYIDKHKTVISSWEAEGRYDIHFVVRMPQLQKALDEVKSWLELLKNAGYK